MKRVIMNEYGGPEVLHLTDAPIPQPGPGEVLLKMEAAGISKPDFLMRTGAYPWTRGILPFYPGLYGTGTVAAVGGDVTKVAVGDLVFVDHPVVCGCYSEYKTAPVGNVTKMIAGTDPVYGAVMTNYVIAWSLMTQVLGPGHGKTLYMKGAAGALGSAVVQMAPLAGYRVIASASTPEKCDYLRNIGATQVFCYKETPEREAVLAATNGIGADIILDQVAGPNMASQLAYLAPLGTILVYNYLGGAEHTGILEAMIAGMAKCQSVRVFSFHYNDDKPEALKLLREQVFTMLHEGKIKPHIFRTFSQAEIQEAHQLLDSGAFTGSLVLKF